MRRAHAAGANENMWAHFMTVGARPASTAALCTAMDNNWGTQCDGHPDRLPAKVMVVDDEAGFRASLSYMLAEWGYEVGTAQDGSIALEQLVGQAYDVVLLDLSMPGMGGLEVLRRLRERGVDSEVVVVSGTTSVIEATAALKAGACDFLGKPHRPEELLRAVSGACRLHMLRHANQAMQERLAESEELHRLIVTHSPDLIFTLDPEGRLTFASERLTEITGYHAAQVLDRPLIELVALQDRRIALNLVQQASQSSGRRHTAELHLLPLGAAGAGVAAVPVELSLVGVHMEGQRERNAGVPCCGIYGSARNLTERRRAAMELQRTSAQLQHIMSSSPAVVYARSQQGRQLSFVSRNVRDLLGYTPDDLLRGGEGLLQWVHPDDRQALLVADRRLAEERQVAVEYRVQHRDGSWRWLRDSARMVSGTSVGEPEVVGSWIDNTEAHFLSEQLAHHASHDTLTGLANRRAFEQRLARLLEGARTGQVRHALCYLDLDQFKVVNDTCGHVAGDALLREVAQLLQSRIRSRDLLARLGGDEFGLLMENCRVADARRVAESLCQVVHGFRFNWAERSFRLGVSIGVVPIGADSAGTTDVLSFADSACYAAKDAGRNRVQVFEHGDAELSRRRGEMEWVACLNRAFDEDRFCLAFQRIIPICAEGEGEEGVHLYELLLRMRDHGGQLVMPGAFLPAAERYHLAARLDKWVVQHAISWLRGHPACRQDLSLCAINLSGHSMGDERLLSLIVDELAGEQGLAGKICFEVTETAAIANLEEAVRFILALKRLGVRFALDDFGSGLSSFGYLKTLPVDFLKIDGMFVENLVSDPVSRAMVRSINDVAKAMGMQTVAEYVDNANTLEELRRIGVDYAQGYWIGKPRPIDELSTV
jgi:diguanylate cyclase (GGDEF)-like protein/PAS domain S-box-containing protein